MLLALAALLVQQNQDRLADEGGTLVVRPEPARDAVRLSWRGGVDAPMGRRLEEAYAQWGGEVSLFIVELDSPGGALAEGKRVIDALEQIRSTHDLETRVGARRICLSMCVPIFLQGQERIAAPNSRWMFHEPASYDAFTGERGVAPEFERRYVADRFFDRYFATSPMTPAWQAWLREEWVGKDVWKTGRELMKEDSGIITRLE